MKLTDINLPVTDTILSIFVPHFSMLILMGWLLGVEPRLRAPQARVLPLHHNHHTGHINTFGGG